VSRTAATPPHGTPARYLGTRTGSRPACRCRPCTDAHTRACAARHVAHLAGRPPRIPADTVTQHVRQLLDRGMSRCQIAIAAGVSKSSVMNAASGKNITFNRTVAEKILAVQPRIVRDTDRLPFIGTQRRIQALHAIGHGPLSISEATGISSYNIRAIAQGERGAITAATYKTVRAAYRKLAAIPGPSIRAREKAIRLGWSPPTAWDNIDDPAARPDVDYRPSRAKPRARTKVVADVARVAELTAAGRTAQQIADELGCHKRTVVRARGRVEMAVAA
jgi:DNA invertase Pin-like site-specific DNA recombinase